MKSTTKRYLFLFGILILGFAITIFITDSYFRNKKENSKKSINKLEVDSVKKSSVGKANDILIEDEGIIDCFSDPISFQGGDLNTFRDWVSKNLKYPEKAAEKGIQGKVFVQFGVDKDGFVCDVSVIRSVDSLLDAEAIRVIKSSPKWTPPKDDESSIKQVFTLPISFVLQ